MPALSSKTSSSNIHSVSQVPNKPTPLHTDKHSNTSSTNSSLLSFSKVSNLILLCNNQIIELSLACPTNNEIFYNLL